MTRGELLQRMSSAELSEWMAYASLEPFGADVTYTAGGIIAATVANTVPRKKGAKAHKPDDFIPKFQEKPKPQTVDQMIQIAQAYTLGLGGQDKRKG